MSDTPHQNSDREGSRMMLEPDAIHETDDGIYLDCPQCGSGISIIHLVNEGRCSGRLDDDMAEVEDDTQLQEGGCGANLSLELVWEG